MKRLSLLTMLLLCSTMFAQTKPPTKTPARAPLAAAAPHSVALSWTQGTVPTPPPVEVITGNKVYRKQVSCTPAPTFVATDLIFTSTTPVTAYTDLTVAPSTTYCYAVTVVASCATCGPATIESTYSLPAQATTPADVPVAPNAPTGLTVGAIANNLVPLQWNAPASQGNFDTVAYYIFRGNQPTLPSPARVMIVPDTQTSFVDTGCRGTCYYAIKAYDVALGKNAFAQSGYSNIAKAVN